MQEWWWSRIWAILGSANLHAFHLLETELLVLCQLQNLWKHFYVVKACKVALFFYAVWKSGKQRGDDKIAGMEAWPLTQSNSIRPGIDMCPVSKIAGRVMLSGLR